MRLIIYIRNKDIYKMSHLLLLICVFLFSICLPQKTKAGEMDFYGVRKGFYYVIDNSLTMYLEAHCVPSDRYYHIKIMDFDRVIYSRNVKFKGGPNLALIRVKLPKEFRESVLEITMDDKYDQKLYFYVDINKPNLKYTLYKSNIDSSPYRRAHGYMKLQKVVTKRDIFYQKCDFYRRPAIRGFVFILIFIIYRIWRYLRWIKKDRLEQTAKLTVR